MSYQSWGHKMASTDVHRAWVPNPVRKAVAAKASKVWFPTEKRWKFATTRWVYGWDPNAKRWVAKGDNGNGRWFHTKRDLVAFADRMVNEWRWAPVSA